MSPHRKRRRDFLGTGMAFLAVGTAGCMEIFTEETPTRTTQLTTVRPTADPTPSSTPTSTRVPPDTQGDSSILTRISPEDGASNGRFGRSTAIENDTAFVGVPGAGTVYVFEKSGSGWTQAAKLTAEEGSDEFFGRSLAVAGDTLLVGATATGSDPKASNSAYVFERTDGAWSRLARLTPGDSGTIERDRFGHSVALVDGRAVVGAQYAVSPEGTRSGAVYVFERTEGEWSQAAKLVPSDADEGGAFGASLAVATGELLVGAPGTFDPDRDNPGSAYAFERAEGEWRRTAKLGSGTADPGAFFGGDLAIANDTALVGASGTERGGVASGVTYVVERSDIFDTGWQATVVLSPGGPDVSDGFGATVELAGNTALVGASTKSTGSVYVFDRSNGLWRQQAELVPEPLPVNGGFGAAIAMTGETALIGAPRVGEENEGAAFVADLTGV